MIGLVGLALIMSVVSLYYYVRVLKAFLVSEDEPSSALENDIHIGPGVRLWLFALAGLVLALGIFPGPAMDFLRAGFGG